MRRPSSLARARSRWLFTLEYRRYLLLFVENPLYELVTEGLLRALKILKSPGEP